MKTIEQLKIIFSLRDVPFNLTESYQASVASIDYSRSSRSKTGGREGGRERGRGEGGKIGLYD